MIRRNEASVTARETVDDGLIVLRAAFDDGTRLSFEPGQFVNVGLERRTGAERRIVQRPYSIASAPRSAEIEFFIRRVDEGKLTPQLCELNVGDRLWINPRSVGRFDLNPVPRDKNIVAVATGTGVAPYLSMVRHFAGAERWRRFAIVHGVRRAAELGYQDELAELQRAYPDIAYVPVCSREPDDSSWSGLRGRVGDVLEPETLARAAGFELDPSTCHVFLCGNPVMVDEQFDALSSAGFVPHRSSAPGNLHAERYWKA